MGADGVFDKMTYLFTALSDEIVITLSHVLAKAGSDKSVLLDEIRVVRYNEAGAEDGHIVAC